jgi:hypothetical protein
MKSVIIMLSLTTPTCDLLISQVTEQGASERLGRIRSLRFGHDVGPQPPVRQIVEVEELRGPSSNHTS